MFKVVLPFFCSVFCVNFVPVLVSWFFLAGTLLFHPELISGFFLFEGVSKAMICLTFWVGAIMLVVRVNVFKKSRDAWLLACVIFLTFFLVLTFVSRRFIHFYLFFEATLLPTLLMIYG